MCHFSDCRRPVKTLDASCKLINLPVNYRFFKNYKLSIILCLRRIAINGRTLDACSEGLNWHNEDLGSVDHSAFMRGVAAIQLVNAANGKIDYT